MIEIDLNRAADFLKRDVYRYLAELQAVELNMPPFPQRVFADSEQPSVLMHVQEFPEWVNATLTGYAPAFLAQCAEWLRDTYGGCRLFSLDASLFTGPEMQRHFDYDPLRRVPCLVCTSLESVLPVDDPRIRLLAEADRPAAERYAERCADPQDLLVDFSDTSSHKVYAAIENGEILGYLTAGPAYRDVWDVWFVHVCDDARRQGLGAKLAASYARDTLTRGLIAYYSGAGGEASERTAKRAGFEVCREVFCAEAKPKE